MIYLLVTILSYALHLLLKLNWIITAILFVYLMLITRLHRKLYDRQMIQVKRYEEVSVYLDILMYAFAKEGKVIRAFEDVVNTLEEGRLRAVVKEALEHMQMGFDDPHFLHNSMKYIEKEYACERIKTIHAFMVHVENYGGSIQMPIEILMDDKARWIQRIDKAIAERKKLFTQILLSVAVSLGICGIILYLPVMNVDISQNILVQIMGCMVVFIDDFIIIKGQKYLTEDWLRLDEMGEDAFYEKKMTEYETYDSLKQRRLSMIIASAPAVLAAGSILLGHEWLFIIFILMAVVFVNQHKIGHALLKKRLIKNLRSAFPRWLLDIALLLQSENVHMAIEKSLETAPAILNSNLKQLLAGIQMQPEAAKPYHVFLKEFNMPDIHSAVGALYSMSVGNWTNADSQIKELISRNLKLMDLADSARLSDKNSGMYLLFLAPVLSASFKLLIDMAVFLLMFLSFKSL